MRCERTSLSLGFFTTRDGSFTRCVVVVLDSWVSLLGNVLKKGVLPHPRDPFKAQVEEELECSTQLGGTAP